MAQPAAILKPGAVAVVTGAAKGIGAAMSVALARHGMKLALFDQDQQGLEQIAAQLKTDVITFVGDVSDRKACERFHAAVKNRFGTPNLLVNNVGMMRRAGPWSSPQEWAEVMDVNFTSALQFQHLFVPDMIAGSEPAAIVNLGSKEGITTPPGHAAYSVAKAGIKVLTEQLEHELRGATRGRVSAHLLVPGYTYTPMNFPDAKPDDPKPDEPWSAEKLVDYFMDRFMKGDFYIICPDNEVTSAIDAKRILWAANDMIENRPALSRWHDEYQLEFSNYMKS